MHRPVKPVARILALVVLCLLTGELSLRAAGALWASARPFVAHHRVTDERLGWRLNPAYTDVDKWCFRNTVVPEHADIVILGDSQTYGYGVAPEKNWPRQLSALIGRSTYNIACSGYSPVHGLALWTDVASLTPRFVVAAIYAGNDLYDTFNLVYGHGQLAHLRSTESALQTAIATLEAARPLAEQARLVTRMGRTPWPLRDLLRNHSALFHFVRQLDGGSTALAARQEGSWRATRERAEQHPDYLHAHDGGAGLRTTLTIAKRLLPMDTSDPRIDEGLRMTLRGLREMSRRSAAIGARFLVLWIPTKELVFAPLVPTESMPGFRRLIEIETDLRRQVLETAVDLDVSFVDALPALRRSLQEGEEPYPDTADGHPTEIGYTRIAGVVAGALAGRWESPGL